MDKRYDVLRQFVKEGEVDEEEETYIWSADERKQPFSQSVTGDIKGRSVQCI